MLILYRAYFCNSINVPYLFFYFWIISLYINIFYIFYVIKNALLVLINNN